MRLEQKPIEGIKVKEVKPAENYDEGGTSETIENYKPTAWLLECDGPPASLYDGETFIMQFVFDPGYPLEAPEVVFLDPVPLHPHIYGNGHICLSILYDEWSPALSVQTVIVSVLSMLASCEEKEPPEDNDM